MANCCKDCDRLQTNAQGSAPQRPAYMQPTMYDHYRNYQKFKTAKAEEQYIKSRKEELIKFDTKFTDWKINAPEEGVPNQFDNFSTQDIVRFRQQLRYNEQFDRSIVDKAPNPKQNDCDPIVKADQTVKKKNSLMVLSHTPVQCPIGSCSRTIGLTSLLSHYLRDHNEDNDVQCQEIVGGKRAVMVFNPHSLEFRENVCLGVLTYGGLNSDRQSLPAERGICMHNAFLPTPHERYEAHLPILLMACRTSWTAMLGDKELEAKVTNPEDATMHLLAFWLVSVQTTKPLHCTLTVYDKLMTASRSNIMRVRHLNDPQNPSVFLPLDTNCLRLSRGEIDILSRDNKDCIYMEVMINEYEVQ